jgi:uncharacterized protein YqgC (DUF456 family)
MTPVAGPIEFSGPELALILLAAAAIFLGPPIAGVFVGRWLYKRRTPPEQRTSSGATRAAIVGGIAGFVLISLIGLIEDLLA